jgi:excisionase family DNA binding protein
MQRRPDRISSDLGCAPPNAGRSRRTWHTPHLAYLDQIFRGLGRTLTRRGGLKGSTAIPNRYAQLTKGESSNRMGAVMNQIADERLMTIVDLSTMLGVPVDTLYGWRHRGEGPRGYRVGRHIRYRRSSVEAWLEEQADRRQSPRE